MYTAVERVSSSGVSGESGVYVCVYSASQCKVGNEESGFPVGQCVGMSRSHVSCLLFCRSLPGDRERETKGRAFEG